MNEGVILAAIRNRLTRELAPPGMTLRPLSVGGDTVGWVDDARARRLAGFPRVFLVSESQVEVQPSLADVASRSAAFADVAAALAAEGALSAWRDERYAVAPSFGGPPWFLLERAAARYFGVHTWAAHLNGLTRLRGELRMWLSRRSPAKAIDPGLLDNLVGGGIAFGMGVAAAVEKEAWEEAGIVSEIARSARAQGSVAVFRARPDGIQRETIFVHDLELPATFTPENQDGEVVEQRLVTLAEAMRLVARPDGPDTVTAEASLVIVDCLLRHGALPAYAPNGAALAALRTARI